MACVLALDQGTTSSRAILFDSSGKILQRAQKQFFQIYPKPGWVERDPAEIWSSQLSVAVEALAHARVPAESTAAIGITNHRETTRLSDRRTGVPVYNAVAWQDRRTASFCDDLRRDGPEQEFQSRSELLIDPYFSGTKLRWLLENVPGMRKRADDGKLAFRTVDTSLIRNLTKGAVHPTDYSNAPRRLLFNTLHTANWDDESLRLLQAPRAVLPQVCPSSDSFGNVVPASFPAPLPIAGVAGDQQSSMFCHGCFSPGLTKTHSARAVSC